MPHLAISELNIYPLKGARGASLQHSRFFSSGLEHDRRWMAVTRCDAAAGGGAEARFVTQRQVSQLATVIAEVVTSGGAQISLRLSSPSGLPSPLIVPLLRAADGAPLLRSRIWSDEVLAVDQGDAAAAWLTAALHPAGGGVGGVGEALRLVAFDDAVSRRRVDPAFAGAADVQTAFSDGYPALLTTTASLLALNAAIAASGNADPSLPMSRFRPNIVVTVRAVRAVPLAAMAFRYAGATHAAGHSDIPLAPAGRLAGHRP